MSGIRLKLEPQNRRYDPDDPRWQSQLRDFRLGLRSETEGVSWEAAPVEGTKGAVSEIILAVGTAGGFEAAREFLQAWLARDRDRRLDIEWEDGGEEHHMTVDAQAIDDQAMDTLAAAVATRLSR